jgi:hypothetical protein
MSVTLFIQFPTGSEPAKRGRMELRFGSVAKAFNHIEAQRKCQHPYFKDAKFTLSKKIKKEWREFEITNIRTRGCDGISNVHYAINARSWLWLGGWKSIFKAVNIENIYDNKLQLELFGHKYPNHNRYHYGGEQFHKNCTELPF